MMYLRPGNLYKDFLVKRMKNDVSEIGLPIKGYTDTGDLISGVLAEADTDDSERKKHLWDQNQHSLTHTIVSEGSPLARKGDLLVMGERMFLVLVVDDAGGLGVATIYYAEERNDLI